MFEIETTQRKGNNAIDCNVFIDGTGYGVITLWDEDKQHANKLAIIKTLATLEKFMQKNNIGWNARFMDWEEWRNKKA